MKRALLVVMTLTLALTAPATVGAQDGPPPLTWVNMVEVEMGTGMQFTQLVAEHDQPIFDALMEDGTIMSWGLGYQMIGPPGLDYAMWVTVPNWAAFSKVEKAFETARQGMSDEDRAAMIEGWKSTVKDGSGSSQIIRHLVFQADPDAPLPKYLRLSAYTVKDTRAGDSGKMFEAYIQPVYQSLLDDGVIGGFGLAVQATHTDASWTHEAWIVFDDFANLDQAEATFMASEGEAPEGEMVAREAAFEAMMEPGTHYDRLLRVVLPGE